MTLISRVHMKHFGVCPSVSDHLIFGFHKPERFVQTSSHVGAAQVQVRDVSGLGFLETMQHKLTGETLAAKIWFDKNVDDPCRERIWIVPGWSPLEDHQSSARNDCAFSLEQPAQVHGPRNRFLIPTVHLAGGIASSSQAVYVGRNSGSSG
jgi:hypothetical protein